MSAITGIYNIKERPILHRDLEMMQEALVHRGPDSNGIWFHGKIGFGHQMSFTTPESLQETLPFYDAEARLAITADARIDNRNELLGSLNLTDEGVSDSALILASYVRWGAKCADHLVGDFAFAIWDGWQHKLFCARDHFGVKPFYYAFQQDEFYFATQVRGLLALPQIPRELNEEKITQYLSLCIFEDKADCFYQQLHRLPAASTLTVNSEGIKVERYWSLDPSREIRFNSNAEYGSAFREVFAEAVRCRLRSIYPLGSALSGGIDSSSITCMARDILQQEGQGRGLQTFSAVYDKLPECDEREYINAVIAQGGIDPHLVPMDEISPYQAYWDVQQAQDEPYYGTTIYLHKGTYTSARFCGVRTMLEGFGGDNAIGHGEKYLVELALGMKWRTLYREAYAVWGTGRKDAIRFAWQMGFKPIITALISNNPDGHGKRIKYPIRHELHKRYQISKIKSDFNRKMQRVWSDREAQYNDLSLGFYQMIFESFDMVCANFGLEGRYPFWDKRLVEFCLAMPPEQKYHNGFSRYIIRHALHGILPPAIQSRKGKADMAPHVDGAMSMDITLLRATLAAQRERLAAYVDIARLDEYFACYLDDVTVRRDTWMYVWPAVTLAAWFAQMK